jgi:hypothetical protein
VKVKIGTTWLAGHPDDPYKSQVSGWRQNGTRLIQEARYLRAEDVQVFDRRNKQTRISFSVTRYHSTTDAAEAFAVQHFDDIPGRAHITIEIQREGGGTILRYLRNAVILSVDSTLHGRTTRHTYQITGGAILKQDPAEIS